MNEYKQDESYWKIFLRRRWVVIIGERSGARQSYDAVEPSDQREGVNHPVTKGSVDLQSTLHVSFWLFNQTHTRGGAHEK